MQTDRDKVPPITFRILLRAFLVGTLVTIVLAIIHGPIWTIYLAGLIVGAPYAAWQAWAIDPQRNRGTDDLRSDND